MPYSARRADVTKIVQWLKCGDECHWENQTKLLSGVIAIFKEMSRPIPRLDKAPRRYRLPTVLPAHAAAIKDAMPYLRGMLAAMHARSRIDALDYGQAALGLLPEG
jgi:hypothetical protein